MRDLNEGSLIAEAEAQITQAVLRLRRLGRTDFATTTTADAARDSGEAYAAIAADTSRTDEYKWTQYARVYKRIIIGLARTLSAEAKSGEAADQADAAKVYGVVGIPGDAASLAMSRRDAGDRVEQLLSEDGDPRRALGELLQRANRSGDEVLCRAIVEAAIRIGDADTANAFSADRPALEAAVDRLWDSEHPRFGSSDVSLSMSVAALKPGALGHLPAYRIDELAASAS